jgi:DNA segregation ATPase FtsK/SpoIIIE-like protein
MIEKESDYKDPFYDKAIVLVKGGFYPSTSGLQRRFHIGYNRAARILDRMEIEGIVSAPSDIGRRTLLET